MATAGGQQVMMTPDGQRVMMTPDGQQVMMTPEGQRVMMTPDGQRVLVGPDGQQVMMSPDGQQVMGPAGQQPLSMTSSPSLILSPDVKVVPAGSPMQEASAPPSQMASPGMIQQQPPAQHVSAPEPEPQPEPEPEVIAQRSPEVPSPEVLRSRENDPVFQPPRDPWGDIESYRTPEKPEEPQVDRRMQQVAGDMPAQATPPRQMPPVAQRPDESAIKAAAMQSQPMEEYGYPTTSMLPGQSEYSQAGVPAGFPSTGTSYAGYAPASNYEAGYPASPLGMSGVAVSSTGASIEIVRAPDGTLKFLENGVETGTISEHEAAKLGIQIKEVAPSRYGRMGVAPVMSSYPQRGTAM